MRLLAERRWDGAVAALTGAEADTPEVLRALLAARAQLGAPATREELQRLLASENPAVRAAAIEGLAQLDEAGVLTELGQYATGDDAVAVRTAAIEALGRSHSRAAVPVLSQTFSSDDRTIKQTSARALLELGEPADQALIDLALEGNTSETRRYAALILLVGRGREHPSVQRLLSHDLDPAVAKLFSEGLHSNHAHSHD
jgi:HEAT repeat protein